MDKITDEQLVKNYREHSDERALEELVGRYVSQIYGYTRRFTGNADTASDITQEVFVKAWKNIKKFDTSKSFKTWIYTIAKRTAIDWMKKKRELPLDPELQIAAPAHQFDVAHDLSLALAQLPVGYRSILHSHITEGFTFREIAESLRQPLNTVKSRYRRGLHQLKDLLRTTK